MNDVHQHRERYSTVAKGGVHKSQEKSTVPVQTARLLDHFQNLNSIQLFSLNQPSGAEPACH